jgi:hypothetical protein
MHFSSLSKGVQLEQHPTPRKIGEFGSLLFRNDLPTGKIPSPLHPPPYLNPRGKSIIENPLIPQI